MSRLFFFAVGLVVQILRLVPRRSAGQTAGIDPNLQFVAKNGTPQIDVERSLPAAKADTAFSTPRHSRSSRTQLSRYETLLAEVNED